MARIRENPPARKPEGIPTVETTTSHHHEADSRFNHTAVQPHQRWRKTVRRTPRLDCGCRATCHCGPFPLSENQIDAWADCARYVMDTAGCTPVLPTEVLRALWRRGGDDRALAEKLRTAGTPS